MELDLGPEIAEFRAELRDSAISGPRSSSMAILLPHPGARQSANPRITF